VPSKTFGFITLAKPTTEKCLAGFWIVGILGKFSRNLIQKIINNMFVTSDMCTCDLSATNMYMILIIMILIIYNKGRVATTYPAAPEPTLVDIAVVDVVVPLDACSNVAVPITPSHQEVAGRRMNERAVM
jgi:hypothetical protein